jgi:hypothetical protein
MPAKRNDTAAMVLRGSELGKHNNTLHKKEAKA